MIIAFEILIPIAIAAVWALKLTETVEILAVSIGVSSISLLLTVTFQKDHLSNYAIGFLSLGLILVAGFVIALNVFSIENLTTSLLFLSYIPIAIIIHLKFSNLNISVEHLVRQASERLLTQLTPDESNLEMDKILAPQNKATAVSLVSVIYIVILSLLGYDNYLTSGVWFACLIPSSMLLHDASILSLNTQQMTLKQQLMYLFLIRIVLCQSKDYFLIWQSIAFASTHIVCSLEFMHTLYSKLGFINVETD